VLRRALLAGKEDVEEGDESNVEGGRSGAVYEMVGSTERKEVMGWQCLWGNFWTSV
jgi:hypothetical protein